ncbi:hypothetical protein HMPREF3182_00380 [Megasphaera hutchinsoni]|uniref:Uncharacterized protein n=1 Tax=Megasphaera hutchinsoni TaxID=1588748 RepID=A0A134CKI3_9FIRM|nr:hypothetical protein HMPREF3182_00380 [Megasphaera hutchinsoni]
MKPFSVNKVLLLHIAFICIFIVFFFFMYSFLFLSLYVFLKNIFCFCTFILLFRSYPFIPLYSPLF